MIRVSRSITLKVWLWTGHFAAAALCRCHRFCPTQPLVSSLPPTSNCCRVISYSLPSCRTFVPLDPQVTLLAVCCVWVSTLMWLQEGKNEASIIYAILPLTSPKWVFISENNSCWVAWWILNIGFLCWNSRYSKQVNFATSILITPNSCTNRIRI